MPNPIPKDDALRDAKAALNGLALRQEMISRNLANVDTPGYQALEVDFESALQSAQKRGDALQMQITDSDHLPPKNGGISTTVRPRTGGSMRADGNTVDIDTELVQMSETGLRYQALSQLVSSKLKLLKYIATGR